MNNIGMMIDVSHVSDETFFDIIKITQKPIIASHSSPRALTPGFERNLNDEMIELIAQNEGVVLVNFGSAFVNSRSNKMFSEIQNTVETWRVKNNFKIEDKKSVQLAEVITNKDGRVDQKLLKSENNIGIYELRFFACDYFNKENLQLTKIKFLDEITIRFGISDDTHYHVPLLISPYGYSTYRGS